ncbi:flagellar export chaperone FliS [bacterium]|nr:flagellar export chaperone FliS [bacterium]
MASFNPYDEYLNIQFGTADQGTLIIMTFNGAIRFCYNAIDCIENDDKIGKGEWLTQAYDAVSELRKSLKPEVDEELVGHISRTYEFICHQITLANVMNSIENVNNALLVLEKLRDTWKEIIHQRRQVAAGVELIG